MDTKNDVIESRSLNDYDWNFRESKPGEGIHSIHPYPAKFIPQIPSRLLDLYQGDSSPVVLDPFCGVGTTLVEAKNRGYESIGIDLHPLACLISRVKTRPLPADYSDISRDIVSTVRDEYGSAEFESVDIPNVDHWFEKSIQKALQLLKSEISTIEDIHTKEALMVALSSIIVKVSNQDSDTRYAAVEKDVSPEDVFRSFARSASRIENAFLKHGNWAKNSAKSTILNRDILQVHPRDISPEIDLIITSPPYPNAYEYWLYHKYRTYWLELGDPKRVKSNEIGARPHYHGSNPQDEGDFERQMNVIFALFDSLVNDSARICFVVGRSKIQGRIVDNAAILERAARRYDFILEDSASREIPSSSKSFNPDYSNINEERILVFSRGRA